MKNKAAVILTVFVGAIIAQGGTVNVKTDPPLQGQAPVQYVTLSRWDAYATGVTFTATESHQTGSVTQWKWTFVNGIPQSAPNNTYSEVSFDINNAYGLSNACSVSLNHTGSNGEQCSSIGDEIATVYVNVQKPNLVFNTSAPSSDDPAPAHVWSVLHILPSNVQFGGMVTYNYASSTYAACPYEYIFTSTPDNAGIKGSDLTIYETAINDETYSKGGTTVSHPVNSKDATYSSNQASVFDTSPAMPANAKMYAFDCPGTPEQVVQSNMAYYGADKYVLVITLTSWPFFQDPNHDHLTMYSPDWHHSFTYTCVKNVVSGRSQQNPYFWSVSY